MRATLLRTGILALGLLAGCGGSASHDELDAQPPSATGGAAGDRPGTAGENATAGSAVTPSGGGNATNAGGAPGGGSQNLGGGSQNLGGGSQNLGGGSQSLGGTAGAGAPAVLTLPPGCVARTPVESADLCSLAVDCDSAPSVRTYCHRLDSGQWDCQCANQDSMYRVENTAGLQACALAARLCADKDPELGAESCERTSETSDQDRCTIDQACAKPVDLGATSDAHAWLMRFGSVRCNRPELGQAFGCSCLNGLQKSDYDLLADSGELACGPFVDFCMSGATPTFDGKEACLPINSHSGSDGCGRTESCAATLPLTGGVSLAHLKQRYASCVANPNGGSECTCGDQDSTVFLFQLSTPPDDASCESSIPNCDPAAVIEATGAASCEPLSIDTGGDDFCSADFSCVQGATVDNRSIVAEGRLILTCRRVETGTPWVCSCASDQKTTQFELGAVGANATEACTQAPAVCLERLGLHLGPAGDPMAPPDPFL